MQKPVQNKNAGPDTFGPLQPAVVGMLLHRFDQRAGARTPERKTFRPKGVFCARYTAPRAATMCRCVCSRECVLLRPREHRRADNSDDCVQRTDPDVRVCDEGLPRPNSAEPGVVVKPSCVFSHALIRRPLGRKVTILAINIVPAVYICFFAGQARG